MCDVLNTRMRKSPLPNGSTDSYNPASFLFDMAAQARRFRFMTREALGA